jgi:hypothetical protein
MSKPPIAPPRTGWRQRLYEVIFESDTPAGKAFDVALLWTILLSIIIVLLESIRGIGTEYGYLLLLSEWGFTILFTVEYLLRLIAVAKPLRYATSFYGIIDLLAILPSYLALFFYRYPVFYRYPHYPLTAGIPDFQAYQLPDRSRRTATGADCQPEQNSGVSVYGDYAGSDYRSNYVRG